MTLNAKCAVCGRLAPRELHEFKVGNPARPSARWDVIAAVYFAGTPDMRRVVAEFCGATCSTEWHRLSREKEAAA